MISRLRHTARAMLLISLTTSFGCDGNSGAAATDDDDRYTVVATTGMLGDIVRQVAGDNADVQTLMGEGVDPHLYNPTRSDIIALDRANVVFYNGLYLEGKMGEVLQKAKRSDKPVVPVGERIADRGYELIGGEKHADPHLWMDVRAWIEAVGVVADALGEFDPSHASAYEANAASYVESLEALDDYARRSLASIPNSRRVLVTAHDAFSYLGRAYDIEVLGIQGISTESEAGLRRINDLVNLLVERGIPAVFVETSVADKNVRALIEGAQSQGHDVRIGGSLFSDAMGSTGTYEGTYIGMIDHNVTTIARALGGDAPAAGLRGKLTEAAE